MQKSDANRKHFFPPNGNKPALINLTDKPVVVAVDNSVSKISRAVRGSNRIDPMQIKKSSLNSLKKDHPTDDSGLITQKIKIRKSCLMC